MYKKLAILLFISIFATNFACSQTQSDKQKTDRKATITIFIDTDRNLVRPDDDAIKGLMTVYYNMMEKYEQILVNDPSVKGDVKVCITISFSGSIANFEVIENTLNNDELSTTVINNLKTCKFKIIPIDKGDSIFDMNFNFSSKPE